MTTRVRPTPSSTRESQESQPYELLSKDAIAKWLDSRKRVGKFQQAQKSSGDITLRDIARHMGCSRAYLYRRIKTPHFSKVRQRLFSKLIAQIENGQLVPEIDRVTLVKILVPPKGEAKPVAPKYSVAFAAAGGPTLKPVARVRPLMEMPQFGSLLTKPK